MRAFILLKEHSASGEKKDVQSSDQLSFHKVRVVHNSSKERVNKTFSCGKKGIRPHSKGPHGTLQSGLCMAPALHVPLCVHKRSSALWLSGMSAEASASGLLFG